MPACRSREVTMPFLDSSGDIDPRAGLGRPPPAPQPITGDVFSSAFRQGNIIGSALANQHGTFAPQEDYSPFDDIKGSPYFDNYASRFYASRSPAETSAIKRQIDREEADKKTLASSGAIGVLAS